ncbi:hypothetical protein [Synechococcus phage Ssp-JY38]|nr:hypothetical protein [Synechococcus phage Yong-L2-223]
MPISLTKVLTDGLPLTRDTGETVAQRIVVCNTSEAQGVEWVQTDDLGTMVETTQFVQPFTRPAACGEAPTIRFTGGSRAVFTYDLSVAATGVRLYDLMSSIVSGGVCGDGAVNWVFAFHDGPTTGSPLVATHAGPEITPAGVVVPISSGQVTIEIRRQGGTAYLDQLRLTESPGNPVDVLIEDPIPGPPGTVRSYVVTVDDMPESLPMSGTGVFDRTVQIPDGGCITFDTIDTVMAPGVYQNTATATEDGQPPLSESGPEITFEGEAVCTFELATFSAALTGGQHIVSGDDLPTGDGVGANPVWQVTLEYSGEGVAFGQEIALPVPAGATANYTWSVVSSDGVTNLSSTGGTGPVALTFDLDQAVEGAGASIVLEIEAEILTAAIGAFEPVATVTLGAGACNPGNDVPETASITVAVFDATCGAVSNIMQDSARVFLSAVADGEVVNPYGFVRWWYSTDGGTTKDYVDAPTGVSNPFVISGLSPNTEYTYGYQVMPSDANFDEVTPITTENECGTFTTLMLNSQVSVSASIEC